MCDNRETRVLELEARIQNLESLLSRLAGATNTLANAVNVIVERHIAEDSVTLAKPQNPA